MKKEDREKLLDEEQARIKNIVSAPVDDMRYLWDETVRQYAVEMEKVKRLLTQKGVPERVGEGTLRRMQNFLDRCADGTFQIALVGTIKAGKSTLINALLDAPLASTEVTPETASLTKFCGADEDYVEVKFYTPEEWQKLWESAMKANTHTFEAEYEDLHAEKEKDKWLGRAPQHITCEDHDALKREIVKWTSSKSPTHYFVSEVIVGVKGFGLAKNVVLVDTPGLNDVVQYRSDITREYIEKANAVLVCVKSDALTGAELMTIQRIFTNAHGQGDKVYIIGTQTDTLNHPREDWAKQQVEWLKYLQENSCYGSRELAEKNIMPVSAWFYTALHQYRDNIIREDDDEFFDLGKVVMGYHVKPGELDAHYEELEDMTNIEQLKNRLMTEVIANYRETLVQDIKVRYEETREDIREQLTGLRHSQEELIEAGRRGLEEVQRKKAEYDTKLADVEQQRADLEKLVKSIKYVTTKRADELVAAIRKFGR